MCEIPDEGYLALPMGTVESPGVCFAGEESGWVLAEKRTYPAPPPPIPTSGNYCLNPAEKRGYPRLSIPTPRNYCLNLEKKNTFLSCGGRKSLVFLLVGGWGGGECVFILT